MKIVPSLISLALGALITLPGWATYTDPIACKKIDERLNRVVREKREALLGRGASGRVYSWRVTLESGRETIAVKKRIVEGRDSNDLEPRLTFIDMLTP